MTGFEKRDVHALELGDVGAAQLVQQRAAGEAVRAEPVQDRPVEARELGDRRVGVQRVAVAARGGRATPGRHAVAYVTSWSASRSGIFGGSAISSPRRLTEAAFAADERGEARVERGLAAVDVGRLVLEAHDRGLALVVDADDRRDRLDLAVGAGSGRARSRPARRAAACGSRTRPSSAGPGRRPSR